ncbi:type II secretion system protein GspD [Vulcanococcus sp.]|jgi:type IV pilus assembly protein PilQ|uniref:type II secretion system protein GspD n=1 Tax=Vulcanococcus sp. TaxID=2856995 RepID=UPI0037DA772D
MIHRGSLAAWGAAAAMASSMATVAAGLAARAQVPARPPQSAQQPPATQSAPSGGALLLQVRRSADGVDVVIQGAGPGPVLRQSQGSSGWQGELQLASPAALRLGPQTMAFPEAGLRQVSIDGSGSSYRIAVSPLPGVPLGRPMVSADGRDLILSFTGVATPPAQTGQFNLKQPGALPQASYAPPLQPRAVAPPLGDMAVGTMVLRNRSYLSLSGPPVTMTLRNAPARDALMALAQMGGYGFVYVGDEPTGTSAPGAASAATPSPTVSLAFRGESYARAINAVLLASGLQAKQEGRMLMVGPSVQSKTFGAQLSKVYRLNQASAGSAADYLASLGARITKVTLITNTVTQGQSQANQVAGGEATQQTKRETITTTETYGAAAGPLRGLSGTTDSRLQTVTLVGDPQVVAVAENYLRQIDLRERQVALSVKILDVALENEAAVKNSFAFRYGNNFIVNDEGRLIGAFNNRLPPTATGMETISGGYQSGKAVQTNVQQTTNSSGTTSNQVQTVAPTNTPAPLNPSTGYAVDNFYDLVRAAIVSSSTKVLASPTLILSENDDPIQGGKEVALAAAAAAAGSNTVLNTASIGRPFSNEAFVTVGSQVITDYVVQAGQNGAPNTCQPQFGTEGLTFGARVLKIDDNGFVSFALSPSISARAGANSLEQVAGCGRINILQVRRLDTGTVRVRDGQTLILTGVISDADNQAVTKWPIVGDLPFVGQFFRSSNNARSKRELVILVTPRVINDGEGGTYGYGYQAVTREARQFMGTGTPGF